MVLIAVALTVTVVASLAYLHASIPPSPASARGAPPPSHLTSGYQTDYDFVNSTTGWALVADYITEQRFWIFRTIDGASHWQRELTGTLPKGYPPEGMLFFDRNHGFVRFRQLYATSDGGTHWKVIVPPAETAGVTFADASHGWALDNGGLYTTVDGGLTWRFVSEVPTAAVFGGAKGPLLALHFRSGGEGWIGATATQPTVYRTTDGGRTWTAVPVPPPKPLPAPSGKGFPYGPPTYRTDVQLLPGGGVLAYSYGDFGSAQVFESDDAGRSWRTIAMPMQQGRFGSVSFIDARHWWVSFGGPVFVTANAGKTWNEVLTTTADSIVDWDLGPATAIDSQHGWRLITRQMGSAWSGLAMSSDGGAHWNPVHVPEPK